MSSLKDILVAEMDRQGFTHENPPTVAEALGILASVSGKVEDPKEIARCAAAEWACFNWVELNRRIDLNNNEPACEIIREAFLAGADWAQYKRDEDDCDTRRN